MPDRALSNPAEPPKRAVLLPGTGSDEVFVRAVFGQPLADLGITAHTPRPRPGDELVAGFLADLDAVTAEQPALVGGISLGAHVAAGWAARNPDRCVGLLLAMPGWLGEPDGMPAAVSARVSAEAIERDGARVALEASTDGAPGWLAAELRRAWPRQGNGLAAALRVAAGSTAPNAETLASVTVPAGVAGCTDDPVHPYEVAERYAAALPVAALGATTLAAMGRSPGALGRAVAQAWVRART
jgi:pimeloyl-ACP methyl ester carboxylesterase